MLKSARNSRVFNTPVHEPSELKDRSDGAIVRYAMMMTKEKRVTCRIVLECMLSYIAETLKSGRDVNLFGFGKFCLLERRLNAKCISLSRVKRPTDSVVVVRFRPANNLKAIMRDIDPLVVRERNAKHARKAPNAYFRKRQEAAERERLLKTQSVEGTQP